MAVPELQMTVYGEYFGNPYPEPAEFTLRAVAQPGANGGYLMTVENSSGGLVGAVAITEAERDGIDRMATTDHDLSGYEDDWTIPSGMRRALTWTLPLGADHLVELNQGQIDEIAAWLRYASGDLEWTAGEEWVF